MKTAGFLAMIALLAGPAWAEPTSQPDVDKILDQVEKSGDAMHSIAARFKYTLNQTLVDEITRRDGSVLGQRTVEKPAPGGADKPAQPQVERISFRIQFDNLVTPVSTSTKKEMWIFDGRWLHEINEKTRMVISRQIVAESASLNPTRLGQGPFPMPFWQKKKDVLNAFDVKLVPPAKDDPKDADHLLLTPKRGSELARTYRKVDMFISRGQGLPVRIVTENVRNEDVITVDVLDVKVNPAIGAEDFRPQKPAGFTVTTEYLGGRKE